MHRPAGVIYPDVRGMLILKSVAGKQQGKAAEKYRYKENTEFHRKVHAVKECHGWISDDITRKTNGYPDQTADY